MSAGQRSSERPSALLIGNSDGIGLATTRMLLADGWRVAGLSRSPSPLGHPDYSHRVQDVAAADFGARLEALVGEHGPFDVCIFCAAVGHGFDPERLERDEQTFATNLLALVTTARCVVPSMLAAGGGHLVGLSSLTDVLIVPDAPAYSASKAGFTSYLRALAPGLAKRGVCVTNVRLGFVDTKLARARVRPFMMSVDAAAGLLLRVLATRPREVGRPRVAALSAGVLGWVLLRWMTLAELVRRVVRRG